MTLVLIPGKLPSAIAKQIVFKYLRKKKAVGPVRVREEKYARCK